jgi:hypothetical protein
MLTVQIGAVLERVEIAGIAQMVADIVRHLGAAHGASSISLKLDFLEAGSWRLVLGGWFFWGWSV